MVAHKQILWQLRLNVVIASSILALLLLYFTPTNTQAQISEQVLFDPTRLVFETVAGNYGSIWGNEVTSSIARVDPKTGRIINHFLYNPQKPEGFPQNIEDFDFEPRDKDIIWVVTKGGVVEYNWNTQTVVNRYPSGTRAKIWPVWTDKENSDLLYGNVWGAGLLKFNKQTG